MKTTRIYITGFMGSGKSTIGKKLAARINYRFIDTDDEIEKKYYKEVKEIFAEEGEAWFRNREEEELARFTGDDSPMIVSLGGGALMSEKNQAVVSSNGILIYIQSSPENIYLRIKHSTRRPLLRNSDTEMNREEYIAKIKNLLRQREDGYNSADIIFNRDAHDAGKCAELLIDLLQKRQVI